MAKVHHIYKQLQRIEDTTVDRAMTAALPTADRLALRLMGLTLLHRRHPEGLLGLVLHYHQLPPDTQHTVADHAGELFRPLREAAEMPHTHGPLNAIHIIHRSLSAKLAYLVSDQLRHGSTEAQGAAAACLLHLARHAASDPRPGVGPDIDPASIDYLQAALEDAVGVFARHEQQSVVVAAAWLLMRGSTALRQTFEDRNHAATRTLAALLETGDQPAILRSLMLLMTREPLTRPAIAGLRRAAKHSQLAPVLAHYHLLSLPALAAPLSRLDDPAALCPGETQARNMAPHECRGLPVWIASLPLERGQAIQHWAKMRHLPDPNTRLMALRRLLHRATPDATDNVLQIIAEYCDDPDPQIARLALHHLIRRKYAHLTKLLMHLINSPHEAVRGEATKRLAPIGFQRLWDAWPKLEKQRREAAGRALLKIDANFQRELGQKLNTTDQATRLRALNMIATLGQGATFESRLRQLAESKDERVASAAVKALGGAQSPAAQQTLENALAHDDQRVRANAVEAMGPDDSSQRVGELMRMAEQETNRPRANAIVALLQAEASDALPSLTRMLGDERAAHRTSALWLVEHMGVLEMARRVADMAQRDPDPEVRRRAEDVAGDLLEAMTRDDSANPDHSHEQHVSAARQHPPREQSKPTPTSQPR